VVNDAPNVAVRHHVGWSLKTCHIFEVYFSWRRWEER
jgi:hypothetical protein